MAILLLFLVVFVVTAEELKKPQDLCDEIQALYDRIDELENKNDEMQNTIKELEEQGCLPYDFSLLFPKKGITDYISKQGMPSLQAITGCYWMRSSDKGNKGTAFSYATSAEDNEVLLYNYQDFSLYIGKQMTGATTVSANDGLWHHICFTWENSAGSWNIYKDGTLAKSDGAALNQGHVIAGGGIITLGQEQDSPGGKLDASQSFVGDLSDVNVWDHVLTAQEISELSKSCHAGNAGNVFQWTDFQTEIHGNVKITRPSACTP